MGKKNDEMKDGFVIGKKGRLHDVASLMAYSERLKREEGTSPGRIGPRVRKRSVPTPARSLHLTPTPRVRRSKNSSR